MVGVGQGRGRGGEGEGGQRENHFVFLGQGQQRRTINYITELCLGEAVGKFCFGGLVKGVVRHEATGAGVVSEG